MGGDSFEELDLDPAIAPVLRSQVACAVLGLVIEKPSHGYEIGMRLEDRFGGFLAAARQRAAYPALRRLEDAGLLEKMAVPRAPGLSRGAKVGASYRATATGARAYRAWLAEVVRSDPQRVEMLGRMTLAGVRSVDAALDFLDQYELSCMRDAQVLVPSPQTEDASPADVTGVLQRLVLDERRRMIDAQLDWINYARAELRALKKRDGGRGDVLL